MKRVDAYRLLTAYIILMCIVILGFVSWKVSNSKTSDYVTPPENTEMLAARLKPFGWHVKIISHTTCYAIQDGAHDEDYWKVANNQEPAGIVYCQLTGKCRWIFTGDPSAIDAVVAFLSARTN